MVVLLLLLLLLQYCFRWDALVMFARLEWYDATTPYILQAMLFFSAMSQQVLLQLLLVLLL